jgi:hypothetical protein
MRKKRKRKLKDRTREEGKRRKRRRWEIEEKEERIRDLKENVKSRWTGAEGSGGSMTGLPAIGESLTEMACGL